MFILIRLVSGQSTFSLFSFLWAFIAVAESKKCPFRNSYKTVLKFIKTILNKSNLL